MKSGICVVEVMRGETVESVHRVHIAIVEAGKGLVAGTDRLDTDLMRVVDHREFENLSRNALPVILNTRGETVGAIRTRLSF